MIVFLLLVHLVLLLTTQFILWPEMVVYPYLMNNGFVLYRDIINPYTPLFNYFLAFFAKIFGYEAFPYQVLTWLIILATDILIFKITKKAATLAFFVFVSIPFGINGLWYDLVQAPFLLGAVYYFSNFLKGTRSDLVKAVALLSVSFFIKQQTIWLALWFLIAFIYTFKKQSLRIFAQNKQLLLIPTAFLLAFISVFYFQTNLKEFFYLAFYFPFIKASLMPGYILLPTLRQAAVVGFLLLVYVSFFKRSSQKNFFLISGSVLMIFAYPRFDYFHLAPSLSVLAVVFGQNIETIKKLNFGRKLLLTAALLALAFNFFRYIAKYSAKEVRF